MTSRKLAAIGLAAALSLALVGCSNSGSTAPGHSASGTSTPKPGQPGTPSSTTGAGQPASPQLTGTQLQQLLITDAQLPVGLTTDPSQNSNSGATLETPTQKYNLPTMSCSDLINNMGDTGYGETATASSYSSNNAQEILNQLIYQFADAATAQSYYTALSSKLAHCGTFTITSSSGSTGPLTTIVGPALAGLGQSAFQVAMTGKQDGTSVASGMLGVLNGTDVYVMETGSLGTGTVPTDINAATIAQQLTANVAKG